MKGIDWNKVASLITWGPLTVDLGTDDTMLHKVILVIPEFRSPFSQTFTIITEEILQTLKDAGGVRPLHFLKLFDSFYPHPRSWNVSRWMFDEFVKGLLVAKWPRQVFEMEEGT